MKVGVQGSPLHRLFSLEELKDSTRNFDQSMYMGEGSAGKVIISNSKHALNIFMECLYEIGLLLVQVQLRCLVVIPLASIAYAVNHVVLNNKLEREREGV